MAASTPHLGPIEEIPFDQLQLDPNNPRIAPDPAPGYADAETLFDPEVQTDLPERVFKAYQADELEQAITRLGWIPIDAIIVWRHPDEPNKAVVVEGNTRTAILRRARTRLATAKARLDKLKSGPRIPGDALADLEKEVARLQQLVDDTATVGVQFVQAKTADELAEKLPRLLGVRHVSGSRHWKPYATNLYITSLYEDAYRSRYTDGRRLKLEDDLIAQVAETFSMSVSDARRAIQTATAFAHFKLNYEDRVKAAGNEFREIDHYYFDQIQRSSYARSQFGFDKHQLQLSDEASEALFQWVFAKPRSGTDEDDDAGDGNVMRKAEDMRVWQALSRYDNKNATTFAAQLDVTNPTEAPTLAQLKLEMDQHKARYTPVQTLGSLLSGLKDVKADTLRAQGTMLAPVLEEIRETANAYLKMIHDQASES